MSEKDNNLIDIPTGDTQSKPEKKIAEPLKVNGSGSNGQPDLIEDDRSILQVFRDGIVAVYRFMRSMRTALILLLILAVASIIGTLIPQESQQVQAVTQWRQTYPSVSALLDFISFFNIYGSWWFQVVILLLLTSLLSCVLPRTKAVFKKLRMKQGAVTERYLTAMNQSIRIDVPLSQDEALERAAEALRKHNYRPKKMEHGDNPPQMFARKGRIGEVGSLFFHYSFVILLVAAVLGKMGGFEGRAFIIEGERWVEQHLQYDSMVEGKLFARSDDHKGFELQIDDFKSTYLGKDQGYMPKDFTTTASIYEGDKLVSQRKIRVNEKLKYNGVKFYQSSYGWAPHIKVVQDRVVDGKKIKEVLYDKPTIFFPGASGQALDARGEFTIPENPDPNDPEQLRIRAQFAPDVSPTTGALQSPYLKNPAMLITVDKGPNRTSLIAQDVIREGIPEIKKAGLTITMPEVKEWTGLEVNKDPGVTAVYFSFTIMILGVMIALYLSHRRVWVAAVPSGSGYKAKTTLIFAGVADKNRNAFAIEFEELAEAVNKAVTAKKN